MRSARSYRDRPVGTLGDAAFFSFQTIKPLNTYGGGMAVVRDPALARRVSYLAQSAPAPAARAINQKLWQGRVQRVATRPQIFTWTMFPLVYACRRLNRSFDAYFWEKIRPFNPLPPGYHVRYANVQAAIGLEGLKHLDRWHAEARRHAARMDRCCVMFPACTSRSCRPIRTSRFTSTPRMCQRGTSLSIAASATASTSRRCTWTSARRCHSFRRLTCQRRARR